MDISNEQLFESALNDEPLVVTEDVTGGEDQGGTLIRDEATGRFVAKTEEPEPKPATQEVKPAIVAEPAAESPGVRQLREALERSNRRADEVERRLIALQPKLEAPARPDIFEQPDKFVQTNVQEALAPIEQKFSSFIETVSRRDALREHGQERVSEAFKALDDAFAAGDPQAQAVVQAVKTTSMDPFGDIVEWYRGAEASRNPEAFFQRRLEEALKDEKFKGELLTKLQPAAEEKPKPVFNIPPSLGRAASAAAALAEGGDLSNESLFENAMR